MSIVSFVTERFTKSEEGATLVEYGVALVLAIVVGGVSLITLSEDVSENMNCGEQVLDNRSTTAVSC